MQLIDIEKRDVKHARIQVTENFSVKLIVPTDFNETEISKLKQKKMSWIMGNLDFFSNYKNEVIPHQEGEILLFGRGYKVIMDNISSETKLDHSNSSIITNRNIAEIKEDPNFYRDLSKKHILSRTEELAKKHSFSYNKIFIRSQKSKWGNCSKNKNISFNWKIIKCPQSVIDYIILHELMHTRIPNHSRIFWINLSILAPNYQDSINWLMTYGKSL